MGIGMRDPCKLWEMIILGQHKVATLIHIWVDCLGHLEKPVLASGVRSLLLEISRVFRSLARQVTLLSYSPVPSFYYALVSPSKIAWVGLGTCGYCYVVHEVGIYYLWNTPGIYVMLIYCLAMLVDGDWYAWSMQVVRDDNFGTT